MANVHLGTLEFGASGSKKSVQPGSNGGWKIPAGLVCKCIEFRFSLPIKNNSASTAYKGSLTKALAYALATFNLACGFAKALKWWVDQNGSNLLLAHRWAYGTLPAASGTGGTTNSYLGTGGLPASTSETLAFYARIPFEHWRMKDRSKLAIGASQFASIFFDNTVGQPAALDASGNIVQNGTMQIDVIARCVPGADVISPGIAFRVNSRDGNYVRLDPALPLVLGETTAPYASTSLAKIDVKIGETVSVDDNTEYVEDYHEDTLAGNQDISDTWTIIAEQEPNTDYKQLPSGLIELNQGPVLQQPTLNLAGLVVPVLDKALRAAIAKPAAQDTKSPIHLVNKVAVDGEQGVPVRSLPFSGVVITRPGDPLYDAMKGEAFNSDGSPAAVYTPPQNNAGIKALRTVSAASAVPGALGGATSSKVRASIVRPPHLGA